MSANSASEVTTSSNNEDASDLKDSLAPRWESNPEEDGENNPTVTIVFSETNAYVENVVLRSTGNVDYVTVTIVDEENNEVNNP